MAQIAEGDLLIFRPKAGKFMLDSEIAAIKHNDTLYYSLRDIIDYFEFQIDYKYERKTGAGWFLREDWLVRFDFEKKEVVSRGKEYAIAPEQIYDDGGDVFIRADAAKDWFTISFTPDVPQQYVAIETPYPFPALARNARSKRSGAAQVNNKPLLPRLETEQKMFDINTLETQQTARYIKRKDRPSEFSQQNVSTLQGDVLKHSFYGTSLWTDEENLTSVRARMTKEEEDPILLGPLQARYYGIGDIDQASLPLSGSSSQNLGVRVNNNTLRNADFQTTNISGDSLPGWDVELYRDGGFVDRIRVEDDARYEFQDIQLYAGDNLFEVFFYGPQGEIRQDSFNIPVDQTFLATQDGTYDVSLTFKETQTYLKDPSDDEDAQTPELVARYNKYIGSTLSYAGVRAAQVNGDQKFYVGGGLTNIWKGFIFDLNLSADEQAATAGQFNIRKNIDDWRLFFGANMRDEDYISGNGGVGSLLGTRATASKNFMTPFDSRLGLTLSSSYDELPGDITETQAGISMTNQMGRLSLTDATTFKRTRADGSVSDSGDTIDELDKISINKKISARYRIGRVYFRIGLDYNVRPNSQIEQYFSQLSYNPSNRINTDLTIEHDPEQRFTESRLSVSYNHDKFRLTPYVGYDSDETLTAGLRLSTSLIDQPGKTMPLVTGRRVSGRGQVSSFVFHDKNGNNIFDGNDEPLPEVLIESVNVNRRAETDSNGRSLIFDLPESIPTDVRVDKNSLPDPFMIAGFEGVSVFPRAGQMVELTFPIHMSGEIDGTVSVLNPATKSRQTSRMKIDLIPVDGRSSDIISVNTAPDGYYILSYIKPGNYLLNVDARDAAEIKAGGIAPRPIRIGYEGTIMTQDITLQKGRAQVPVELEEYTGTDHKGPFFALDTANTEGRSKLAVLLEKMIERRSDKNAKVGLVPIAMEGHQNLKVLPGADWDAHYERCQILNDGHIPCKVILFVPAKTAKATRTASR